MTQSPMKTWFGWGIHLIVYLVFAGIYVESKVAFGALGMPILLGWFGLLFLHVMWIGASTPDKEEKRKRGASLDSTHLELGDDGELALEDVYDKQPERRAGYDEV